ncbi:AraC family transcriptional regulator [Solirubrobacter ginsenosidimutans]|uniref:AraC family transcriptional regulator n=1 Tax=Solirubrobacter ginsenosidimutans TaxID=490573 RepID=A0A9X3S2G8_9ACTN|nr:AraC family transcriptional regulator [Solirubrobacter ginsenosidimutans]MDA0162287.1 AraC family transcriptional regulator [Solirubrobacter ginsenosidimutans]
MDIAVDRLPQELQVVLLDDASFGSEAPQGAREPHRHDYHELIWARRGDGEHSIDGERFAVVPGTVTLIGRGQIHVFERARRLSGAVVRFGPEMQHEGPGWLVGGRGSRTVPVPPSEVPALESTIAMLAAETARPRDAHGLDVQRHLLSVLLLWVERWYDATRTERRDPDDTDVQLYRRFDGVLERDFARHHDAAWYAEALAVPAAQLSRSLSQVTGRTTKQLITDRVMLEAARLLRFTDLNVGEIAFRAGFEDQLYFSRAFKRHYGEAPTSYREQYLG